MWQKRVVLISKRLGPNFIVQKNTSVTLASVDFVLL